MKNKCTVMLIIITSSILAVFFSLLILMSLLLKKVEKQGVAITEIHQTLSDLQIESIEYAED